MALILVAPVLQHLSEIKLANDFVGRNQSVHVGAKAQVRINTLLIKFDLNEAVRVGSDDKVNLSPVNHDHLFDVVDDIGQLLLVNLHGRLVVLRRFEVSMKNFGLMQPLSL